MDYEALFDGIGLEKDGRESFWQLHSRKDDPSFSASVTEGFRAYEEGDPAFGKFLNDFSAQENMPVEVLTLYFYLLKAAETYNIYTNKGIDPEVFNTTLRAVSSYCAMNRRKTGIYGIPQQIYRRWLRKYLDCKIYQLGTLHYELISSAYDLKIGNVTVSKGDLVLSVHIPGKTLDAVSCERSYAVARMFFKKYYKMKSPVFFCFSWLMQPWLTEVLPPNSRIVQFQRNYLIIDFVDDPEDMLLWVFPEHFANIEDYPEDTSLRRYTKDRMRQGGILGYGVGVRL